MAYSKVRRLDTGEIRDDMVRLVEGEAVAFILADPDNPLWLAYEAWCAEGNVPAEPPAVSAAIVPDGPTLSDWRVGLTLWGRIDDVTARVAALIASTDARQAMLGRIAKERLEYANTVLREQLMSLREALGFSAEDVDESLWRADRVRQRDLSGQWPVPTATA